MNYDDLLEECAANGIYVIEKANFKSKADGLINGDVIGLNRKILTTKERACVLSEELGHYYTTVGNILDQKTASERKQELRARAWSYNRLVGLNGIINSYKHKCQSLDEVAEFLDVKKKFLIDALEYYKGKYGIYTTVDNYAIYFEPSLGVLELV